MAVVVLAVERRFQRLEKPVFRIVRLVLHYLKQKRVSLAIYLVGDREMRKNVLSYPTSPEFPRPDVRGRYLGEVLVNPEYIQRRGESLSGIVIHGLLHLLGYDHKKKHGRIRMECEEERILAYVKNTKFGNDKFL